LADREDSIEFRLLGPFEVSERGQPLEVGAGKQRALLALLLLRAGEVVSTDRLIEALWEEHPPASAVNSVSASRTSATPRPYGRNSVLWGSSTVESARSMPLKRGSIRGSSMKNPPYAAST
jgi:hypothetical protein